MKTSVWHLYLKFQSRLQVFSRIREGMSNKVKKKRLNKKAEVSL